ncbi:MAG: sulfatase-like hydrolase/transferase, partial [Deltaproteobacteria bacterium]|nr:sulfatase-like hydrolase/transferase [Deltaproteobacteria bacterium]
AAGAKRCSVYGYPRPTTPALEMLTREARLYKYCFAPSPWTIPSHASLFSGLYPSEHGCGLFNRDLPETAQNLPEFLQKIGYRTVSLTSNLLVSQAGFGQFHGMNRLFNSPRFLKARQAIADFKKVSKNDFRRLLFLIRYCWNNKYYSLLLDNFLDKIYRKYFGDVKSKSQYATERTFFLAKRLLKKYAASQPLFIFINCLETHWLYYPPSKYIKSANLNSVELRQVKQLDFFDMFYKEVPENLINILVKLYELSLQYITDKVCDFYHFLGKLGLRDQTMFIVTSDHGESLGEHGLWGHNFGLYNEVLHIPLLIKYPGDIGVSGESTQLVQLHDVFATIMEVVRSPWPVPESSRSLLSESRAFALAEHLIPVGIRGILRRAPHFQPTREMLPCRAIIAGNLWKLVEWEDGRLELYNLIDDYAETRNLASDPQCAALKGHLYSELHRQLGPFPPVDWSFMPTPLSAGSGKASTSVEDEPF